MSAAVNEPLCPRCARPLSATITTDQPGDQLAAARIKCPHCGASLVRDVEGHADRGWRVDEEPND
jgi:ribosomal protein S27AE